MNAATLTATAPRAPMARVARDRAHSAREYCQCCPMPGNSRQLRRQERRTARQALRNAQDD